jgi:hypothetical protein
MLQDARGGSGLEVNVMRLLQLAVIEHRRPRPTEALQAIAGLSVEKVEVLLVEIGDVDSFVWHHNELAGPVGQSVGHLAHVGRQLTPPKVCPIVGRILAFESPGHSLCPEEL